MKPTVDDPASCIEAAMRTPVNPYPGYYGMSLWHYFAAEALPAAAAHAAADAGRTGEPSEADIADRAARIADELSLECVRRMEPLDDEQQRHE